MTIPIFCINLDRATERKEKTKQEWIDSLGFDIQFWKAYDRRDIENNKHIYEYVPKKTNSFLKRDLSNGEIACITSFCMLYEYAIEKKYDEIIVMEDDISPLIKNINILYDTITNAKKEYPKFNFIVLHGKNPSIKKQKIISSTKHFSEISPVPWGNMFIYLDKIAINKIYKTLKQIVCPADHAQRILFSRKELNVIVVNSSLCIHNTNKTYIGNDIRFEKNIREFIP